MKAILISLLVFTLFSCNNDSKMLQEYFAAKYSPMSNRIDNAGKLINEKAGSYKFVSLTAQELFTQGTIDDETRGGILADYELLNVANYKENRDGKSKNVCFLLCYQDFDQPKVDTTFTLDNLRSDLNITGSRPLFSYFKKAQTDGFNTLFESGSSYYPDYFASIDEVKSKIDQDFAENAYEYLALVKLRYFIKPCLVDDESYLTGFISGQVDVYDLDDLSLYTSYISCAESDSSAFTNVYHSLTDDLEQNFFKDITFRFKNAGSL